ncbi:MAG: START-like domain-containing protein [Bacteroidota bacterium]|nr:START-like domain-containing protein [Bacteroidota bacterium]
MSKKNKGSSGKAKGSSKNIKKAAKPAVKKSVKKVIKKAPTKKKVVKKPIAKKKLAPKKVVKASKPIKPARPIPAKIVKPEKAVKVVAKKEIKKESATGGPKVLEKKVVISKPVEEKIVLTKKEIAEEKKNEVLAIMNTIPKTEIPQLSASKIASITSSITNPVKKQGAYAVKVEKEPNGKFELEFGCRASSEMLYEFFSTASGLSEWFCDDVNIRNGIYTFIWDGQMQQARLLKTVDNQLARYQWVDKTDGSYFEFRIQRDDLTNDISLMVTDFAESKADQESAKLLWHSQVEKLMHVIGSIF